MAEEPNKKPSTAIDKKKKQNCPELKVMSTDQIQKYAGIFNVEWRKIYDLDSQFQSLVKIEIQELQA